MADRYLEWADAIPDDPRSPMIAEFTSRLADDARVLDLGCGAGVPSTRELAQRFRVVGVDISPVQIDLARKNVPEAQFIEGDFSAIAFREGAFDGVVALYSVSHLPREDHSLLFAKVWRWLAPGGLFLATLGDSDSPDWIGDWLGTPMFFSGHDADTNRRLLREAGFDLLTDEVLDTHEPDGDAPFLWAIGQKPLA